MAQVAVCCGVGGTGKTTTAAALAVSHAQVGKRVVVLTIDPARRLADALGLDTLSNDPSPVALPSGSGRLSALMLDRKGTWDAVIRRHARPRTAEALLSNPYYQAVSTRLSGSHEYMAVEKLYELVHGGDYDMVVVDTPPTQHVVDFFQAPDRVRGILDRTLLSRLFESRGFRGAATRGAMAIIERIAGDSVMDDIRGFFELIGELSAGFRDRSAEVQRLLTSAQTRYWLVAHADAPERNDLLGFLAELRERGMTFAGFLVNRVQRVPQGPFPTREELLSSQDADAWGPMVDALLGLPARAEARARRQRSAVASLTKAAGGSPAWLVPDMAGGVRTVEGLQQLASHLPPAPPASTGRY